jgi:hypothetical protein
LFGSVIVATVVDLHQVPMPPKIKRRKPALSRKEELIKGRTTRTEKKALQEAAKRAGLDLAGPGRPF